MNRFVELALSAIFLFFVFDSASAQQSTKAEAKRFYENESERFRVLRDSRREQLDAVAQLERESTRLSDEVTRLEEEMEFDGDVDVDQLAARVKRIDEVLEKRKPGAEPATFKEATPILVLTNRFSDISTESLTSLKQGYQTDIKEAEDSAKKLATAKTASATADSALEAARKALQKTEDEIGVALAYRGEEYKYRTLVSGIFALIVLVLVILFFYIIHADNSVTVSIFSGDAGIQFITLFSIVIAVILFGILDILQANELSALLGGLSGYILGKARATATVDSISTALAPKPAG